MKKKLLTKRNKRIITWSLFIIFSSVLFINNSTSLLEKWSTTYNINYITWIGIIGSIGYAWWKSMNKSF